MVHTTEEVSVVSSIYPGKEALFSSIHSRVFWLTGAGVLGQEKNQNIRVRLEGEDFRFLLSPVTFVTWVKARPKQGSTVGKLISSYLFKPIL